MNGILVSFGELFIKSKPVQELFKRKLENNIKQAFARNKIKAKIEPSYDKLFLKIEDKNAILVLKNIPGISNICPCFILKTNNPKEVIYFI